MSHSRLTFWNETIGVAFVGFSASLCVHGITIGQILVYLRHHCQGTETFWSRVYVGAIWAGDILRTFLVCYVMFHYVVKSHQMSARIGEEIWTHGAIVLVTEYETTLVRLGYAYRIWKFNNRKPLVPITLVALSCLIIGFGTVLGVKQLGLESFRKIRSIEWLLYIAWTLQIIVDVFIAAAMSTVFGRYYTGVNGLDSLIQTVLLYVISAGFLSVILTTLSVIMYLVLPGSLVYISLYWVIAEVHTCSFLSVLNAEKDLARRMRARSERESAMFTTALSVDEGLMTGLQPSSAETIQLSVIPQHTPYTLSTAIELLEVPRRSPDTRESSIIHAV